MNNNIKNEISYLKKISGIQFTTIRSCNFLEIGEKISLSNVFNQTFSFEDLSNTSNEDIKDILRILKNKPKQTSVKAYHIQVKIGFGQFDPGDKVEWQKIVSHTNKKIPCYVIPAIMELRLLPDGNGNDSDIQMKFIISDKPFIIQELFDYGNDMDEDNSLREIYLPIFNIDKADEAQKEMLSLYNDSKKGYLPLLEKKDDNIDPLEYLESLELKEAQTWPVLYQHIEKHLNDQFARTDINHHNQKILISLSDKDVDVLYKAYQLVEASYEQKALTDLVARKEKRLYESFFGQKNNKTDKDKKIFDATEHLGSFKINIDDKNNLFGLSLNQRLAVNAGTKDKFKPHEVLTVNGPPGTGKTTLLQSIIANMIAENALYPDNHHQITWSSDLVFPKQLNIGCSFTQQAVKNILSSLDFDKPLYNGSVIDLIWNNRWIKYKDDELKYVYDLANGPKDQDSYFIENIKAVKESYLAELNKLSPLSPKSFIESSIQTLKSNLDSFKLEFFNDLFIMNDSYMYEAKFKSRALEEIKEDIRVKEQKYDELSSEYQQLSEELKELFNEKDDNTASLNIRKNNKELMQKQEDKIIAPTPEMEIEVTNLEQELKKIKAEQNRLQVETDTLQDELKLVTDAMNDREKSIVYKVMKLFTGKDKIYTDLEEKKKGLDRKAKELKNSSIEIQNQYNNTLENIKSKKIEILLILNTQINEQEQIEADLIVKIANAKELRIKNEESKTLVSDQIKVLQYEQHEKVKYDSAVQTYIFNIQKQLHHLRSGSDFYYAEHSAKKLSDKLDVSMNLLDLYTELNCILDNTIRYKMFHLAMRLKEWNFIELSQKISQLSESERFDGYNKKSKLFKNTKEVFQLHYLSLLYPLMISTLHSLGKRMKIYANQKNFILPSQVDNLIVDESGQISLDLGFMAFWNARRMVSVGDTDQIKPVYPVEYKLDYLISKKLKRIDSNLELENYGTFEDNLGGINCSTNSVMGTAQKLSDYHQYPHLSRGFYLVEHRRCPDEIIQYCNEIVYKGILIPKTGIFESKIKKEHPVTQELIMNPWEFIHAAGEVKNNQNEEETRLIIDTLEDFINKNKDLSWENVGKEIAILTPYRKQADLLLKEIHKKAKSLHPWKNRLRVDKKQDTENDLIIGTVHALQGAEKKIILFSLVKQDLTDNDMIIKDKSILNVAVSRSKLHIKLYGNEKILYKNYREMELIREYCGKY
jgi:energy-coupling factor transporter ATP-binding protein EcfA2